MCLEAAATILPMHPRTHTRTCTVIAHTPASPPPAGQAYASKKAALEAGDLSGGRWAPLWDRLVFSKIRAKLGGQVKYLTSGGLNLVI